MFLLQMSILLRIYHYENFHHKGFKSTQYTLFTKLIIYIYRVNIEWKYGLTENLIFNLDTTICPLVKQLCFIQLLVTL